MIDDGDYGGFGGMGMGRETAILGETLPSATLSTINPT
jgi:hypothetical protein